MYIQSKSKDHLDAWQKLPDGRLKVICRDPGNRAKFRVIYKGVEYYSDMIEIDGESSVSMRRVGDKENVFCVCTTSSVNLMR